VIPTKQNQRVNFSVVFVSPLKTRKTKQRRWKTFYPATSKTILHTSYTARGFAVMTCSCLETLHAAAKAIGLARGFFDSAHGVYLISSNKRKAAGKLGAQLATVK
jgi:hypothetical protein